MNRIRRYAILGALLFLLVTVSMATGKGASTKSISIDAKHPTDIILPNIADNINIWQMGNSFVNPVVEFHEFNEFQFVKWVQLMLCCGGSEQRDLFITPQDRSVLNDYDFDLLIKNCEGIISLGAKPYLKLGATPLKLSSTPIINNSGFNICPPDSYEEYYRYIKSLLIALVDYFGRDEVVSWRFGCWDEYENGSVFCAQSGDPKDSFVAYCKLYDYTVQALIDVLGEQVFVGAHSMSVLDGLWDERDFIQHVAKGRNYANGKIGTKLSSLSVSFYDNAPGRLSGRSLTNTIKPLQDKVSECGLKDLIYGVDEGRILTGVKGNQSDVLNSRASGYTWQAAEDARLYSQAIDLGMDYFSAWNYLTGGNFKGFPTISYHVANNMSKFSGYRRIYVSYPIINGKDSEIGCIAGVNKDTVRVMFYNFSSNLHSEGIDDISMDIILPFSCHRAKIVKYLINDDCNFFDEWLDDREQYKISNNSFWCSPDDGEVESPNVLYDKKARDIYFEQLREKYIDCSMLKPETAIVNTKSGRYKETIHLMKNNVLFFQISRH